MLAEDAIVLRYGEVVGEIDAFRYLGWGLGLSGLNGRCADGRAVRGD